LNKLPATNSHLLGIDTGGTFTDFVYLHNDEFKVHKVLSTPEAPQQAIFKGISDMGLVPLVADGKIKIIHGTTVATNATLEGKGVSTAYITNRGLADVLSIGRQTRPELYNLKVTKPSIDLSKELIFEVDARLDASGKEISSFASGQLQDLKAKIEALAPRSIAINLLFSFMNDAHEREIEALFDDRFFVSRSSFVLPEYREYERGIATWVNAWIGPLIDEYLIAVKESLKPSTVAIMQSSGVTISAHQASRRAVNLLLSGPVGGLQAAKTICKEQKLMTFDMGGTSTDVALLDGEIKLSNESQIANLPIAIPMADIHTIGAGGGSIAYIDEGGLLQVGPASAGANPGPACYGRGGTQATVTDANLVLGRLQAENFLGGAMFLDTQASSSALSPLAKQLDITVEQTAEGIVKIANEHMTQALRAISIQRGFDPREFTLVCFGGAGGLHFCELAEALEMRRAVVPVDSGVLSAFGMLATNPGREIARTQRQLLRDTSDAELCASFAELRVQGEAELKEESNLKPEASYSLDLRYLGQTFTLPVTYPIESSSVGIESRLQNTEEKFHEQHQKRYGHRLDKEVELLNLRVHLEIPAARIKLPDLDLADEVLSPVIKNLPGLGEVPIFERKMIPPNHEIIGPALITETHATTLIKENWKMKVDSKGKLNLEKIST
jgi:N-methylhydantoinase A